MQVLAFSKVTLIFALCASVIQQSGAQTLTLEELPEVAQKMVKKNPAKLAFRGFLNGGQEVILTGNDGLLRQVSLTEGKLIRTMGATAGRDRNLFNWAVSDLASKQLCPGNEILTCSADLSGDFFHYTDANTLEAYLIAADTGRVIYKSSSAMTGWGCWWSSSGELFVNPMSHREPGTNGREHSFPLIAINPISGDVRVARTWSLAAHHAPEWGTSAPAKWRGSRLNIPVLGGSFGIQNRDFTTGKEVVFFSEESETLDRVFPSPIPVPPVSDRSGKITAATNQFDVHSGTGNILNFDPKTGDLWVFGLGFPIPKRLCVYEASAAEQGDDSMLTKVLWTGPDKFVIASIGFKMTATKRIRTLRKWSARSLAAPEEVLSSTIPTWASADMSFTPDGSWVYRSDGSIWSIVENKGYAFTSNYAVHPSEAKVTVKPLN